ncbi:hypothetical protein HaLaN_20956 [Haematococcus lacustris]|uniref:Uncharacterized protein n=1 Tax=Haematococcus lacustris TaxID=44745 RepID=A0A699ZN23_HAELA|nr:hypothetical protein HaLaN_20956 [Haematococcus lacustris]
MPAAAQATVTPGWHGGLILSTVLTHTRPTLRMLDAQLLHRTEDFVQCALASHDSSHDIWHIRRVRANAKPRLCPWWADVGGGGGLDCRRYAVGGALRTAA